jgi:hypothetical protein
MRGELWHRHNAQFNTFSSNSVAGAATLFDTLSTLLLTNLPTSTFTLTTFLFSKELTLPP